MECMEAAAEVFRCYIKRVSTRGMARGLASYLACCRAWGFALYLDLGADLWAPGYEELRAVHEGRVPPVAAALGVAPRWRGVFDREYARAARGQIRRTVARLASPRRIGDG